MKLQITPEIVAISENAGKSTTSRYDTDRIQFHGPDGRVYVTNAHSLYSTQIRTIDGEPLDATVSLINPADIKEAEKLKGKGTTISELDTTEGTLTAITARGKAVVFNDVIEEGAFPDGHRLMSLVQNAENYRADKGVTLSIKELEALVKTAKKIKVESVKLTLHESDPQVNPVAFELGPDRAVEGVIAPLHP